MEKRRPTANEIHLEAARIISLPIVYRDLILADIWYLSRPKNTFLNNGNIVDYIKKVEAFYVGWKRPDFSILYYVITGEEVIEN